MASVRITDTIRSHVQQQLNRMQNKRVEAAKDKIDRSLCTKAIKKKMGHYEAEQAVFDLEKTTQERWVKRQSDFLLRTSNGNLSLKLNEEIKVALRHANGYSSTTITIEKEEFPELYDHMEGIFARCKKIQLEYDNLRQSLVHEVLGKCTTLKQVLELWPTALDFMPESVIQRHREKTTRQSRRKLHEEIQVDETVKATLAKERMINGSQ